MASRPPREVPPHVVKAARGGGGGCGLLIFGLLFAAFGMVFVYIFFPWQFMDEIRLAGPNRVTRGEIRLVSDTSMSVNDTKVVSYVFAFTAEGGGKREGICYTTGRRWSEGTTVSVRYVAGNPAVACVDGARLTLGGVGGAFVLIFPLAGFGLAGWFLLARWRTGRLLRDGVLSEVDIVSVDETTMKVNYQTVYRIVLQGPALNAGRPVTVKRVNKGDVDLALRHAREKQPLFVLHDPRTPTRVIFPEALITRV